MVACFNFRLPFYKMLPNTWPRYWRSGNSSWLETRNWHRHWKRKDCTRTQRQWAVRKGKSVTQVYIHPIIFLFLSGSLSAGTDSYDVMKSALIHSRCGNDICTCGWKICIYKALSITLAWEPTAFSVCISMGRGTFCHNLEKVFIFCEDSCGLPIGYGNLLCENNKLDSFRLIWWWRTGLTLHCLWNVDKLITSVQNNKGAFGWVQARCWQLSNFFRQIDNSDKDACGYVIWFHT